MNQHLLNFQQFVLQQALSNQKGLIILSSNNISIQHTAINSLLESLKNDYPGFIVFKDNKFPQDDLTLLHNFLKPNTIIFVNQIFNSSHYSEILHLAKDNLVISRFECFSSLHNPFNDFLSRFQKRTLLDLDFIKDTILGGLFCYLQEETLSTQYQLFLSEKYLNK